MEYKTHFYSFCLIFIVVSYWPWSFNNLYLPGCAPYNSTPVEVEYPFKSWAECRATLERDEISSESLYQYINMPMIDEIQLRGYNASSLSIVSEDGYISTVYRISGCLKSPPRVGKKAVLLFHGGFGGSASWIIQPGSRNLAFMLVDAGYEVWLANLRGTTPSQNHTYLDAENDLEYWNFSFDDIGTKDVPLFVDLILKETDTKKLYFGCHCAGCISYFIGLTEKPELNEKFEAGFLLAPSMHCGSSTSLMIKIWAMIVGGPLENVMFSLLKGRINVEPGSLVSFFGLTPDNICQSRTLRCGFCDNMFYALYGSDAAQLNYTELPNIFGKLQDTYGLGLLIHGMQMFKSCRFLKPDLGKERNLVQYGSAKPPTYDFNRVAVPTYIFYGESDNMVTPSDVAKTKDVIPTGYMRGFYKVKWPLFNHVDFLMAKDADILVYDKILKLINKIESESVRKIVKIP